MPNISSLGEVMDKIEQKKNEKIEYFTRNRHKIQRWITLEKFDRAKEMIEKLQKEEEYFPFVDLYSQLKEDLIGLKKEEIKYQRNHIQTMIQDSEFSEAYENVNGLIEDCMQEGFSSLLKELRKDIILIKKMEIKKKVVELGTSFNRLLVKEVAEDCEVCDIEDSDKIVRVVNEMIEEGEIFAKYFQSSQAIVFNQQANIKALKDLDDQFESWMDNERTKHGKVE